MRARHLQSRTHLRCGIGKGAVPHVAEHGVRLLVLMMAIEVHVFAHVRIREEQIFMTVVVEIERPYAPAGK